MEMDLAFGLLGVILFRFWNQDKRFVNWISGFVIVLFLSEAFYFISDSLLAQVTWLISSAGLLFFYSLRFKNKDNKKGIDFLKPLGLIVLIIYPVTFYSLAHVEGSEYWMILRSLTFYLLGTIFIYDRWILKPEAMKKKYVIILVSQSVLILTMLTFALYQKSQADIAT